MKTPYEEIVDQLDRQAALGDDYDLREVTLWRVHCKHCGVMLINSTPQTDKAFEALKRLLPRQCRNPNCVSRGGTERRRT